MKFREISTEGFVPTEVRDQPAPTMDWVELERCVVDERYQREITMPGRRLIQRIASGWDWTKYQPILCAATLDGRFAVVDGQRRAHVARSLSPLFGGSSSRFLCVETVERPERLERRMIHLSAASAGNTAGSTRRQPPGVALNQSGAVAGSCDPVRARGNHPPSRHRRGRMNVVSCLSPTKRGFRPPRLSEVTG